MYERHNRGLRDLPCWNTFYGPGSGHAEALSYLIYRNCSFPSVGESMNPKLPDHPDSKSRAWLAGHLGTLPHDPHECFNETF